MSRPARPSSTPQGIAAWSAMATCWNGRSKLHSVISVSSSHGFATDAPSRNVKHSGRRSCRRICAGRPASKRCIRGCISSLGDDPPADPVHVLLREHPIKRHGRPPSREGAGLPCARNRCALVRPHLVPFHPASALFHPTTCRAAPMSPSPGRSRPAHRANTRLHHICRGDVARGSGAAPSRGHQDVPSVNASPSSTIRIFILWRRTVAGSSHEYREHPSPVPWRCTPRRPGGGVLSPAYHTRTPRGTSPCLRRRTFRLPVAPTRANVDVTCPP